MNTIRNHNEIQSLAESLGPTEKLLNLIINFPDHLWHNRPGVIVNGKWRAATASQINEYNTNGKLTQGEYRLPGPNNEAIVRVYQTISEIWKANNELAARLASYIMKETSWRDMKVVCASFMLVQNRYGEPIRDDETGKFLFADDDYREVGEAMIKSYKRGSDRMLNPKLILRIRDVLSLPEVSKINRDLGFGHSQKRKPFTGRYYKTVQDWLTFRENNPSLLAGLKKAGYGNTVKNMARMVGYKPQSQRFFEILGWHQKQSSLGHRKVGLKDLKIERLSFEGLTEEEICEKIVRERLGWKLVMGMLPPELGLTPAICVALLDQFSDKDFVILTPTLEEFGLLKHERILNRWTEALDRQDDQRARNVAQNIRNRELASQLDKAADKAITNVVNEATKGANIHIMFLIDISASMQGAIELSKQALSMIVQGFPKDKLHISCFNTVGYLMKPRHYSAKGIQHMLKTVSASGGTLYASGMAVFQVNGVNIPDDANLIVFTVGDEAGESGENFARYIKGFGYNPSAFAHIVNVTSGWGRGRTVRDASECLGVPYMEVDVEQLTDVYQVQRTLKAVLEAQPFKGRESLIEKVLKTELLQKPY